MHPFVDQFRSLNDQQKRAVETIEGPVMVVAGPGTGKTQVIALRVAQILKKTQMRPGNILCLTFSVSGAVAMRERLRSLIGPDAYGVQVKNFHAFCNDLIQEHPLVFDDWSALEQISDIERFRLVNRIIDEMMPDCVLVNRKRPYDRTREILGRLSELKREGKTDPENLRGIAAEYASIMETKSKAGTKQHQKNLLAARKFGEFIELFLSYQQLLKETQRYDYDDMILYVTEALQSEDWLLQGLQEKYQYILVDEFQDTNGAQWNLVSLLTTFTGLDHEPNLFVVGDDDQAIYRFQGANLANILKFRDRFPSAPVIPLTTTYRCTQQILDAAGSLIGENSERLVGRIDGLEKRLQSSRNGKDPVLLFSPSDATEPWLIADLTEDRMQAGVHPEDIAVLVQTNAELLPLYEVLSQRGIPVQMNGKIDLLQNGHVRELIAMLRAIDAPLDNAVFAAALSCSCFALHPADLARLFHLRRAQECSLHDLLLRMDDPRQESPLPLVDLASIIHARDALLSLHQKYPVRSIIETLEHALKDTGLIAKARGEAEGSTFDALDFAALQEFFERVKKRAYEQPSFGLKQLLADLDYYGHPEYGDLRLRYDLPHLTEKGVQLMTAHQSKGLEFSVVILANFREGHWDHRRRPSGVSLPEDLLFGWEKEQKSFEHAQDERRLCFVAMTRARDELIFTCPRELTSGDRTRDVSPSAFFAEAGQLPEEHRELRHPDQAATLLLPPVVIGDEAYRTFLHDRLKDYALSVTALNHFLEDPRLFLEVDLLQTPQAKRAELVYGNAVHDALRKWALSVQKGDPLTERAFIESFDGYLNDREVLTHAERERLRKTGHESLPAYYEERLAGKTPFIHRIEWSITTRLGEIPITGKIDRVDLQGPESADASVIDFKTGAPKTEKQILEGDYHRQLVFYALLLRSGASFLRPQSYSLDFIGEGNEDPVQRSFSISLDEERRLASIVKVVWEKIMALDFSPMDEHALAAYFSVLDKGMAEEASFHHAERKIVQRRPAGGRRVPAGSKK